MVINKAKRIGTAASFATAVLFATLAQAQTRTNWVGTPAVEKAWDEGDVGGGEGVNWTSIGGDHFQPNGTFGGIGEYGSISNGGIALIDHAITVSPADIRLAQDASSTGSLVIRNGGSIAVARGSAAGDLGVLANGVAGGGVGRLTLRDNIGAVQLNNYAQTAASTLVVQLSSAGSFTTPVQVSDGIALAGTLRVERTPASGFVAAAGNSWTMFQGAPVTGNFATVDVDAALRSNAGQVFSVSTASNAVTLSVAQRLVLQVDRFTGATILRNPSGHATNISLISYTLHSPSTTLASSDARWKSFQDAAQPNWFEANPTTVDLSELNPTSSRTFTPGTTHDFGTPFTANMSAPLRTDRVNLSGTTFKYQLPDGSLVDAPIETVGRFNDLVLVVNPTTGFATLQNQSAQSVELISYTISSASNSLLPSFAGSGRPNWFKANPTTHDLSELGSTSSILLAQGGEVDLGLAWSTAGSQDLTFAYQTTAGTLLPGTVSFGQKAIIGLAGDYNSNGIVDAADYVVWRKSNINGPQGYADWRANFGKTLAGSGSSALASAAAVPEPAAWFLAVIGVWAALWQNKSRRGLQVQQC
jgi:hypothetical protein